MEIIKIKTIDNQTNYPTADMLILLGKIKNKFDTDLTIIMPNLSDSFASKNANTLTQSQIVLEFANLLKFYNITNIRLTERELPCSNIVQLKSDYDLNFFDKDISKNPNTKKFLAEYEHYFGQIPFFDKNNLIDEKIDFLTNVILSSDPDLVSH